MNFLNNLFVFFYLLNGLYFVSTLKFHLYMKKDKTLIKDNFYIPKTTNQILYQNFLNDDNLKLIIAVGPAGTGKTLFACLKAIEQLKSGQINKLVITRPVVTVDE